MSERKEYTPSMDEIEDSFDRAIAVRDQVLRERIARDIEARRNDPGQIELATRFGGYHAGQSDGLDIAARIARGGGPDR